MSDDIITLNTVIIMSFALNSIGASINHTTNKNDDENCNNEKNDFNADFMWIDGANSMF